MDSSPIRVVLPAGDAFAPAFVEAATTYSGRKQHASDHAKAFIKLVELGCLCANSAGPSSVELTVSGATTDTTVTIRGLQPTSALSQGATTNFSHAAKAAGATWSADNAAGSVEFALSSG